MKLIVAGLFSFGLLIGAPGYADHHADDENWTPTQQECEALAQAQADSMETGEELTDEQRRRLEICERGIEIEMNDDGDNDH